jgi:predicted aspartyl protease
MDELSTTARRMRVAAMGLVVAALVAAFAEQGLPAQQRRAMAAPSQAPTYATLEGDRAEVALDPQEIVPVIPLMINGKGPFRMGLDTGMPDTLAIRETVAETLGLAPTGTVSIGDGSAAGRPEVATYMLDRVSFGGLTYGKVESNGMRFPPGSRSTHDGIIGLTMFRDLLLTVDYKAHRLTAERGSLPTPDGRGIVETRRHPVGFILVPVTIGDRTHHVMLDTGNRVGQLLLQPEVVAGLPTRGEPRTVGTARTINSSATISAVDLAAPVRVGATTIPVTSVTYPSAAPMGNLGGRGLVGMRVAIDQKNRRVSITAG